MRSTRHKSLKRTKERRVFPPTLVLPAALHYNPPTSSWSSSGRRPSRSSGSSALGTSVLTDRSWSQILGSIVLAWVFFSFAIMANERNNSDCIKVKICIAWFMVVTSEWFLCKEEMLQHFFYRETHEE